ncbi:MAG: hypothetical protein PF589_06480 [Gammaproteobacteria bacterium]|jgi:hypothetical protein|nr:hypothetical protein [Gammaproteobacteria bacterium]
MTTAIHGDVSPETAAGAETKWRSGGRILINAERFESSVADRGKTAGLCLAAEA